MKSYEGGEFFLVISLKSNLEEEYAFKASELENQYEELKKEISLLKQKESEVLLILDEEKIEYEKQEKTQNDNLTKLNNIITQSKKRNNSITNTKQSNNSFNPNLLLSSESYNNSNIDIVNYLDIDNDCFSLKAKQLNLPSDFEHFGKFLHEYIKSQEDYKQKYLDQVSTFKAKICSLLTKNKVNDRFLPDYLIELWQKIDVNYSTRFLILEELVCM